MTISLLHISDLHRDPSHPLGNAALLESLARDRERYTCETPAIGAPDLVLVSGDVVTGVTPTASDATAKLEAQYVEASEFLSSLADEFLGGNRERIVIVPGNHDVSYPHVCASLNRVLPLTAFGVPGGRTTLCVGAGAATGVPPTAPGPASSVREQRTLHPQAPWSLTPGRFLPPIRS